MLSIRTQDRKGLELYDVPIRIESWYAKGKIVAYHITQFRDNESITLGQYEKMERALEVLDEIERHVLGKIIITETNYAKKEHLEIGTSPYRQEDIIDVIQLPQVYQMPKE